ncbi:phosphonate C-P lyase system protein PhnG [Sulfuriferula thiophila]|uniref:phosphonate C-P lyase system protein PhnG n=1 Tax=Sulfuriferula thiophila TaxID=1781211 RepID=UPI000F60DA4C|nr:phosphonate C-P lyase system protein PhnG [Sulfuriferula thiophila]
MINIPRNKWPSALCSLPASEVRYLADVLSGELEVRDVALPHAGLGLLNMREGAFQESYFIGEIPVARAEVVIRDMAGNEVRGGALIVDDRVQLARAIAILDAVIAGKLPGWVNAMTLVQQGLEAHQQNETERKHLLAATRVDFSLLGQEDDEDEE